MKDFIFTTPHWGVDIMDDQTYFGRLVLVARATRSTLPELAEDEQKDFFSLIGRLEDFFKREYGATMFNYSCLMNNAYRDGKAPQVHFHFRPRYEHPITIKGHTFTDPNFGEHYLSPSLHQVEKRVLPEEVKQDLISKLSGAFA